MKIPGNTIQTKYMRYYLTHIHTGSESLVKLELNNDHNKVKNPPVNIDHILFEISLGRIHQELYNSLIGS